MSARLLSLHAAGTGLPKESAAQLRLIAGVGAEGDRHAGKDPDRALLVTPVASYRAIAADGLGLDYGMLGENLVVDEVNPHELPSGTRLGIGEGVLELTHACTVCSSLSTIDLRLPKLAYGRRGVYARVLRGGVVTVGMPVTVLRDRTDSRERADRSQLIRESVQTP